MDSVWVPRNTFTAMAEAGIKPQSETLRLLYEHARNGPARQVSAGDAIDAKTFQLFAAATVVLGLGSFAAAHLTRWATAFYLAAIAAYAVAGWSAWAILRARKYQVVDRGDRFWPSHRLADSDYVREQLLDDIAEATVHNHTVLDEKGEPLDRLLIAIAVEAACVAVSTIIVALGY